jgi:uncharacterized repeat protein (TIGR01451 family)
VLISWIALAASPCAAQDPESQSVAVATGSGPLETSIVVETLQLDTDAGGHETRRWKLAERVRSGEQVHYTVRVTNPGKVPVADVVVTKRLPFGVHYQLGTATGPACEVQFSSDGGSTFRTPKAVPASKGTPKSTAEYTHVRWILRRPLSPGATALLRFRATFS